MISKDRRKFRIEKRDEEWLLYEPGFLYVAGHRTDTHEQMLDDFLHILKAEQVKRRGSVR